MALLQVTVKFVKNIKTFVPSCISDRGMFHPLISESIKRSCEGTAKQTSLSCSGPYYSVTVTSRYAYHKQMGSLLCAIAIVP